MSFNILYIKIKYYLIFTILSLLIVLCIGIYIAFTAIIFDDFTQKTLQSSKQLIKSIELRMKFNEQATNIFANQHNVLNTLSSNKLDTYFNAELAEYRSTNDDIYGIMIYGLNNKTYASSAYYLQDFSEYVMENSYFKNFKSKNTPSTWLLLKQAPKGVKYFGKDNDMLLYISVLYNKSNQIQGYLMADISLKAFANLFNHSPLSYLKNASIFIVTDKNTVVKLYPQSKKNDIEKVIIPYLNLQDGYRIIDNRSMIITQLLNNSNMKLLIYLPLTNIQAQFKLIKNLFVLFCITFILISIQSSSLLASSISIPLNNLYIKMKSYFGDIHK